MNKENNIIISIIIPVYNVEKYIEKCLRSCSNQDIPTERYEIIVVNDGTKDKSFEIAQKISTEYNNYILLDKPNGGASSARNAGLRLASGKYVWFIDSDDWIRDNCLAELIAMLEIKDLDALQIPYYNVLNEKLILPENPLVLESSEIMESQEYVNSLRFHPGIAATIFKRSISEENKIFFQENLKWGEDQVFFLEVFFYAKKVKREKFLVYYYLNNNNSLTNNTRPEFFFDIYEHLKIAKDKFGFNYHLSRSLVWILVYLMKHKNVNIPTLNSKLKELNIAHFSKALNLDTNQRFKIFMYKYFGIVFLYLCNYTYFVLRFLKSKIV